MIARNFRRHPDALALQLCLEFGQVVVRRIRALSAPAPKPLPKTMGAVKRAEDHERVPIGAVVRTPLKKLARVESYRGFRRGHRVWLVCRYLEPENKRFDIVQLLPERVEVMQKPEDSQRGQ